MRNLDLLRNKLMEFLEKNRDRKKIVVINSHDKVDILADMMRNLSNNFGSNMSIMWFKSEVPIQLNNLGIKITTLDNYLRPEDYAKIDEYVFEDVSKKWERGIGEAHKDVFVYRGIELARLAEYDLQLFLLPRVKALFMIDKVLKKEGCEAFFIIDSNMELGRFDRLLEGLYRIPTVLFEIHDRESLRRALRRKTASLISWLADNIAPLFIKKGSDMVVIDAGLYFQLSPRHPSNFILTMFEKGLRLRLRSLFERRGYVAFKIGPTPEIVGRWKKAFHGFDISILKERFVFENLSYWEAVKDRIELLIYGDFARFRRNVEILLNLQKAAKLKSIVLRNDVKEVEKTLVFSAKKNGIFSFVIQHGILAEFNGHKLLFADKIAVWGEYAAGWYERFGNDRQKIVVVGRPGCERIYNKRDSPRNEEILWKMGFKMRRKSLATLISPGQSMLRQTAFLFDDVTEVMVRAVIDAVKHIGDVNLVIKLHPQEDPRSFSRLISPEEGDFIRAIRDVNIYDLIKLSDFVITMDSTVGLDAVIMDRPLVVVNFNKRPDLVPYAAKGVAVGVYKKMEVEETIKRVLHDDDLKKHMSRARESFINEFIYEPRGYATDRIIHLIADSK